MGQFFKGLAVFCFAVFGLYSCSSYMGGKFLGMLAGTTTDPRQLGLVETGSMTPVTLKLISNTYRHDHRCPPPERDCFTVSRLPTPAFITFKIPAAYINQADVRLGNNEGQFISFELWSQTFDPVNVDVVADKIRCSQTAGCPDYIRMQAADSQAAKRRAAGEYDFFIAMNSGINDPANALRDFTVRAHQRATWGNSDPCQIDFDHQIGMTVSQPPPGIEPQRACGFSNTTDRRFSGKQRDRSTLTPRGFLKLDGDGKPLMAIACHSYERNPGAEPTGLCFMTAQFGLFHYMTLVPNARAHEYDSLRLRINAFLDKYIVDRANPEIPEYKPMTRTP